MWGKLQCGHLGGLAAGIASLALAAALAGSVTAQSTDIEKTFHEGTLAMRNGQLDVAASDFQNVISAMPRFPEAHFNLGLVQLQQGKLDDAINSLKRSLSLKPSLRGANLFLGIAEYRNNDYPDAIAAIKHETATDPKNAKAWMWLGVAQLGAGDADGASTSLDKAAALSPDDVDILYHRGRAHILVSKKSYERMYKADPNSSRVHQVLAQSFVEQDRLEEAAHECQEALKLKSDEPGLHEELGDIYLKQNHLAEAESEFQNELKIDPQSQTSMYKLAVVSLERSKPEVASSLLQDLLRRDPHSADAHYQLGRAQSQLGNTDEAVNQFALAVKEATQFGSTDSDTLRQSYYQLAQLYRRQQKPEESKAALENFMRLKQQADAQQAQRLQDKLKRSAQMQDAPQ
jgi:tetratricopeptide (TPR) repeat protein